MNNREILLNLLYDRMIDWNISSERKNIPIWTFLDMTAREYFIFSSNPEKWADSCFEKFSDK